MGRKTSVAHLHISWSNDCLVITLPRHKGDQSGANSQPRNIFANVHAPEICPILALAIYAFSYGFRQKNKRGTFFFHTVFHTKKSARGTYSLRKGSATYVHQFDVVSETSVNLRAGWSSGKVRSKYVFGTPGADQLIGRLLCGLDITNVEKFMCLQPYFHTRDILEWEEYREVISLFSSYREIVRLRHYGIIGSLDQPHLRELYLSVSSRIKNLSSLRAEPN